MLIDSVLNAFTIFTTFQKICHSDVKTCHFQRHSSSTFSKQVDTDHKTRGAPGCINAATMSVMQNMQIETSSCRVSQIIVRFHKNPQVSDREI